jgi:hypothetical protein
MEEIGSIGDCYKTNTTNADGSRRLAPDMGTYINEVEMVSLLITLIHRLKILHRQV